MIDNSVISDDLDDDIDDSESEESTSVDDGDEGTDNVGDPSVEINVEDLIQELETQGLSNIGREQDARRRLEELMERKRARRELEDFDDYEI